MFELEEILERWEHRYRLQRAVRWTARGLAAGLALALLISSAALLAQRWLPGDYLSVALLLPLASALLAAGLGYLWPLASQQLARRFDRLFGLHERLSTALELSEADSQPMKELQLADTLAAARRVQPAAGLPLRWGRTEAVAAVLLIAALAALGLWARPSFEAARQAQLEQAAIRAEAEQVDSLLAEIESATSLTAEERQALSEPLQDSQQRLSNAESLEEALAAVQQAESQLRSLEQPAAAESLQQAGQQLAETPGEGLQTLAESLSSGDPGAVAEDLTALDPAELTPEERAALSKSLQTAADGLQASRPDLAQQLQDASQALQSGDPAAAQEALNQAAAALAQDAAQAAAQADAAAAAAGELAQSQGRLLAASPGMQPAEQATAGSGGGPEQAGSGAGRGEGQAGEEPGSQAGAAPLQPNNGPGDGGEQPFEPLYAPQRLGPGQGPDIQLPGSGEGGEDVIGQAPVSPGETGPSSVPYVDLLPEFSAAAQQAIDSGQVPASYRELIRRYFSSLEP